MRRGACRYKGRWEGDCRRPCGNGTVEYFGGNEGTHMIKLSRAMHKHVRVHTCLYNWCKLSKLCGL